MDVFLVTLCIDHFVFLFLFFFSFTLTTEIYGDEDGSYKS